MTLFSKSFSLLYVPVALCLLTLIKKSSIKKNKNALSDGYKFNQTWAEETFEKAFKIDVLVFYAEILPSWSVIYIFCHNHAGVVLVHLNYIICYFWLEINKHSRHKRNYKIMDKRIIHHISVWEQKLVNLSNGSWFGMLHRVRACRKLEEHEKA